MGTRGVTGTRGRAAWRLWARVGLTGRTITASILLSALIGGVFFLLLLAIQNQRDASLAARHTRQTLVAADKLELLVVDTETGARGYVITGKPRFLQPWTMARDAIPGQARTLQRLAASISPVQAARVRQLVAGVSGYVRGYSDPLVATARHDLAAARTPAVTDEGKRRLDAVRARFARFEAAESKLLAARAAQVDATAHRNVAVAAAAVAGSVILILLSGGWLARAVVRPVRRASRMADQVAGGELAARLPGTGPAEIGTLERSLNTMTDSLAADRDDLQRTARQQAALRRVAMLVARGVPPPEVFGAVATETGRALQADSAAVIRQGRDGMVTVVGSWSASGLDGPALGSRWPVAQESNLGLVLQSGAPARVTSYDGVGGELSAWARRQGLRSSVGTPITVGGNTWGLAIAFSDDAGPAPDGTEDQMLGFTELASMAIANTESQAQLVASRARLVASADETRRRFERDLHDGAQQRLIALALELRAAETKVPPEHAEIAEQYARAARDLTDVVDDLRTISRGLYPTVLERAGLGPALRALARRAAVPVELSVQLPGRLPKPAEVAAYYVVSEALTNAAKHADASMVEVDLGMSDGTLRLLVRDDGAGGADPARGSGLLGLSDRIEALGGRIEVTSVPGCGTSLLATVPVESALPGCPVPGQRLSGGFRSGASEPLLVNVGHGAQQSRAVAVIR